ncbi:hypothetical protein L1887_57294 [Cichorium endivia]|nr:hypothetical protein L1887_57294 [Cichorium endivia]
MVFCQCRGAALQRLRSVSRHEQMVWRVGGAAPTALSMAASRPLSEPGSRDLQRRLGNGGVRRGRRLSAAPDTLVIYAERSLGPRPNSRLAEPTSSFAHTSLSSECRRQSVEGHVRSHAHADVLGHRLLHHRIRRRRLGTLLGLLLFATKEALARDEGEGRAAQVLVVIQLHALASDYSRGSTQARVTILEHVQRWLG